MRFEIICGVLIVILLILIWKIVVMRRAVKEIREGITQKLETGQLVTHFPLSSPTASV